MEDNFAQYAFVAVLLWDLFCGLKAYRNEVVKNIEVYGDMHRFIPYLAKQAGFGKIGEKEVHHQARKYGKSKFGLERFIHGFLDLMTIWFLQKFGKKPMHFFGSMLFLTGFIAELISRSNQDRNRYNIRERLR